MWPQITVLIMSGITLFVNAANDGKPKKTNYSIEVAMISCGVEFFLLWQGGFWHALGWQ